MKKISIKELTPATDHTCDKNILRNSSENDKNNIPNTHNAYKLDNTTIMNSFQEYMAKKSDVQENWIFFFLSAFFLFFIYGTKDSIKHKFMLPFFTAVLLFCAGSAYVNKYTHKGSLADFIVSHAFDAKTYFKLLAKKMIPIEICSFSVVFLVCILHKTSFRTTLLFECMFLVIPLIAIVLKYIAFELLICHQNMKFWTDIAFLGGFYEPFFRILMVECASFEFTGDILALFSSHPLIKSIRENSAICFRLPNDSFELLCIGIASVIGAAFSTLDCTTKLLGSRIKLKKPVLAGLIIIYLLSAAAYCFSI